MPGHKLPYELNNEAHFDVDASLADGDTMAVELWNQIFEIATGASGETNSLPDPEKDGQRIRINCRSHGGGDRVITADSAINQAGNTIMTFGAVDDMCILESFHVGSDAYEWRIVANDGVALS